jgi:Zn-dependent protease
LRDLSIGLLVIIALPLVWFGRYIFREPLFVLAAVSIFSSAFLFHEIAHKFSAQMMGFWSEFRLNTLGLAITLVSLFSPLKIVAPGAVLVSGSLYLSDYGKISLAGPLTNIVMAALFFALDLNFNTSTTWIGVYINSLLALFNMIPFGMFDGAKIFRWNWRIWLVTILIAGALFFYSSVF